MTTTQAAPNYSTRDPRGWGGDPARGAALGRPSAHSSGHVGRFCLRKVRLDSGGYDPNGTYFGIGEPLYWAASEDGEVDFMLRAPSRNVARGIVLEQYPGAKVRR